MTQLLDPWIPNAKGPKGAVGPSGARWQPPEQFGVAKGGNEMAQLLDPWIKDAKGAKGPFPG